MEMETAVAVMHEDTFLGLVTRSDLLNRLRLKPISANDIINIGASP